MFNITPDGINQLNDHDLQELVGCFCAAKLVSRGLAAAAVTRGVNQTASDGGIDLRFELHSGVIVEGFIPRGSTGFQFKKPDMPRSEIISEMRPAGPACQDTGFAGLIFHSIPGLPTSPT
ncbi:hypothetical protein [Pseudomonas sp. NA-150]|uniref:hypothetical protein n=1 Tax=Pseudomonas sp. NA-150 TaxID=3367525 RepID=UPI0037C7D15B